MQLAVGRIYRAKKPAPAGYVKRSFNDRVIVWMDETRVKYTGPAIGSDRRLPVVDRKAFEDWACRDVTDQLPNGMWQKWEEAE